jgi:hypothetical protein
MRPASASGGGLAPKVSQRFTTPAEVIASAEVYSVFWKAGMAPEILGFSRGEGPTSDATCDRRRTKGSRLNRFPIVPQSG